MREVIDLYSFSMPSIHQLQNHIVVISEAVKTILDSLSFSSRPFRHTIAITQVVASHVLTACSDSLF